MKLVSELIELKIYVLIKVCSLRWKFVEMYVFWLKHIIVARERVEMEIHLVIRASL